MKLLEEVGIRFLIGIFIAALIGFLFWWFVIHNESDRIVERNFQKFYNALNDVCSKKATLNNPIKIYVEIPQKRYTNPIEVGINWIKEKLGIPVPFTAFQDPYYNFHWEKFPPEEPYTLGEGVSETLAAFFIPWSEDLPWSSNLATTMMFMTFALGVDVLGIKGLKESISNVMGHIKFKTSIYVKNFLKNSDSIRGIIRAINGLEKYTIKIKDKIYEIEKGLIRVKNLAEEVLHEIKFTSKVSLMYTAFCLLIEDKTLQECALEGVAVGITADVGKVFLRKKAIPYIEKKMNFYFQLAKQKFKSGITKFVDYVSESINEIKYWFKGSNKDIFKNIDDFNKIIDEIEEMIENSKKLIEEGRSKEALDKLVEIKEKLGKAIEILDEASKETSEEFLSFFSSAKLNIEMLQDEIEEISKKLEVTEIDDVVKSFVSFSDVYKALDDLHDDIYNKPVGKVLKKKGFKIEYDEKLKRNVYILIEENNKELFNDFRTALKVSDEKIYSYGDFKFQYDEKGNLIKIIYDPFDENSFSNKMKELFIGYPKKFLAMLEEKAFIHNKLVDGDAVIKILEDLKDEIQKNENLRKRLIKSFNKIGKEISDEDLIKNIDETIRKYKSGENLVLIVEKNSELGKLLDKLPNDISPQELSHFVRKIIWDATEMGDSTELRNLYGLISGKTLRIREDLGIFFRRGVIGYAALRSIDLYTPLGASWWDKLISYYGYEGQKIPAACQTICEEGKICLQLGACVRQFDLPESCQKIGIKNMKLKRDSIVAKNPRFYLVSPCYAELEIFIDSSDATIFIYPKIDLSKQPNYCYATKAFVDWYIGTYIAQYTIRCASAIGCAIATVGIGTVDAVLACLFGAASGVCGIVADSVDLIFSLWKESTLIWPTVYQTYPWLAS